MRRFVFASDSFKGTLSSEQTARLLAQAATEVFPTATYTTIPMADGGEGTEEALVHALGGEHVLVRIHEPDARTLDGAPPRTARYGLAQEGIAIIEMAEAAPITRSSRQLRDMLYMGTYGVGELVRDALDRGCEHVFITLGGSATNDGGMGMMRMLGARFLDEAGNELDGSAQSLGLVRRIDTSHLHPRISQTRFTAMCDVDNPLTGPDGATYVFGPQKCGKAAGWRDEELDALEAGMQNYERVLAQTFSREIGRVPGAGAAGGLGAACLAFLDAELKPGIETVLDLVGFDELLESCDLVITGEGRLDAQTARGKVICGIAEHCAAYDVPCVAIAGSVEPGAEALPGLTAAVPVALGPCTLEECMRDAESLYLLAAQRVFALYHAGVGSRK